MAAPILAVSILRSRAAVQGGERERQKLRDVNGPGFGACKLPYSVKTNRGFGTLWNSRLGR